MFYHFECILHDLLYLKLLNFNGIKGEAFANFVHKEENAAYIHFLLLIT